VCSHDAMSRRRYATLRAYFKATREPQAEIARRVGVTPSAMSLYVRCKRIPQPAIALKLAQVCSVSLESLLSGKGSKAAA
jgi:transcriptional regulator with XRE-family HTH domain